MSGSAKGVTAAKLRGRKYIHNRGYIDLADWLIEFLEGKNNAK